ncbi:hypothetical protein D9611_002599 [Ephemerocybe angulata]|uniref:MARVEL domain-containing protein n=1 Tax=Ephemerocybe angulata TaxID=980116 RepID=A0A8H5FE15_9AGAR|nr:hypothetical protein D9611_002599 [Tulosesus angulatus]
MTVRFGNNRLGFYIAVFLLSGAVLGLSANFASNFEASFKGGFIIFAIIVTSLQIFTFLLLLQWSQPRIEMVVLFIFGALWLAMGAWATDIIGNVQCTELSGSIKAKGGKDFSQRAYCNEMKVIQAFSWGLFAAFVIAFYILNQLITQAKRYGRWEITKEPIRELPWFDEAPGYYNQHTTGQPQQYAAGYPAQYGGYPMSPGMGPMSAGGHSVVIQPGINGAPPMVTQIPASHI